MNLLDRSANYEKSDVLKFREHQYNLIPQFIKLCISYLESLGMKINPTDYYESIIDDVGYHGINHFSTVIVKIKLSKSHKEYFLNLTIPKLIDGNFFKLNSVLYVPGFYICDEPITVKKKSSIFYSLFTPMTLYTKENRAIILGDNIPLTRIFRLFYTEDEIIDLSEHLGFEYIKESLNQSLIQLSDTFCCTPTLEDVTTRLNNIFFDPWTKGLYQTYYNFDEITLKNVFDQLVINYNNKEEKSFIDLHYKRLALAEILLAPLFKAVSVSIKNVLKGTNIYKLNINIGDIIDHFYMKLNRFQMFDSVNAYSALLSLKATFSNPSGSGELPSEVSSIHKTFKGRIDPISISNTDPGKVINLCCDTKLSNLDYGIFKFDD